jgi:peptidase M48-like protein
VLRRYCALSLSLFIPLQPVDQKVNVLSLPEQVDGPYVSLLELTYPADHSRDELRSLKSIIEHDRDQQLEKARTLEKGLKEELAAAQKELQQLNESSSRDTVSMAGRRTDLHVQVAALERAIRDKEIEREHVIPDAFEIKLAKLRVVEHWPGRREEILRRIEDGHARERKHGDIDDIGYRKLVPDQQKDVALGEQAVRQMKSSGLMPWEVQDPEVQQYVRRLTARIAANSDLKVPLHVNVLDSAEINAIALPGGFLFVTSGLIVAAETEAELAGVLSREVARIAARHGARAARRSVISKIFVPAAQVATGLFTGGVSNAGAYYGITYGTQGLGMLVDKTLLDADGKYLKEADQLGIQYAWKSGFDPRGFVSFLDSLAKDKHDSRIADSFRTNPALGERVVDVFSEIQYLPSRESYTVDSAEFRKARQRLQDQRMR